MKFILDSKQWNWTQLTLAVKEQEEPNDYNSHDAQRRRHGGLRMLREGIFFVLWVEFSFTAFVQSDLQLTKMT